MNYRRLALIVGFIVVVILFAWGLYSLIFSNLVTTPGTQDPNDPGSLPGVDPGGVPVDPGDPGDPTLPTFPGGQLTPDEVAQGGATIVNDFGEGSAAGAIQSDEGLRYFDTANNIFVSVDNQGQARQLGSQEFFNVERVLWTPDSNAAVIEYPDGSNIYYDFNQDKQITLPKELRDFAINSSGTGLAAIWEGDNPENNWLMVSDIDGSNLQIVEPVGDKINDVQVAISPDSQVVGLFRKAYDAGRQEIFPLGRNQENYQSFIVDGLKFEAEYSPGGQDLLYNVSSPKDDYKPRLWLTEGQTGNLGYSHTNLQLNTWADKCTFNKTGSSLYCAVPLDLPRGAGLFPELADDIPDVFYRIDLVSGLKIPLALPVGSQDSYTADNLFLSGDESQLYFLDKNTDRLHSIRLK